MVCWLVEPQPVLSGVTTTGAALSAAVWMASGPPEGTSSNAAHAGVTQIVVAASATTTSQKAPVEPHGRQIR